MKIDKSCILDKICYTELVYGRINKKLKMNLDKNEIEKMLYDAIDQTDIAQFEVIGKNYYVSNYEENIRLTINKNTYRIITVDRI